MLMSMKVLASPLDRQDRHSSKPMGTNTIVQILVTSVRSILTSEFAWHAFVPVPLALSCMCVVLSRFHSAKELGPCTLVGWKACTYIPFGAVIVLPLC
jgi:hypothetical protein